MLLDIFPLCRLAALVIALVAVATLAPGRADAQTPRKPWTLDDIYGPDAPKWDRGDLPEVVSWLPDGEHLLVKTDNGLAKLAVRTGERIALYDAPTAATRLASNGPWAGHGPMASALQPAAVILNDKKTSAILETEAGTLSLDLNSGAITPLFEAAKPDAAPQTVPVSRTTSTSPDGNLIAFVRGGNLYVAPKADPKAEKQLTRDGSETILNGQQDWVYEEEVYGRGQKRAYWWSPDSKKIAFLRIDDRPLKPFPIIDHLPRQQNVETWYYPLAGDPNPVATLWVVSVDGSAPPKAVDLSHYPDADRLVVRVAWQKDSKGLTFQMQNRIATFLDLNFADVSTGKYRTVLHETTPAWTEIIDDPTFLKDGSFLWLSEKTGYRHIYHYKATGELIAQITKGNWDVRDIRDVNEDTGIVSFVGSKDSPIANNTYQVKLDGSDLKRLTAGEGDHRVQFSPDGRFFLDTYSTCAAPPTMTVREAENGGVVRVLADNATLKAKLATYAQAAPEFLQVKTRDGFTMEAQMIKPANFDPNKIYPVFMMVYAGPGAQTVRNGWGGGASRYEQLLTQQGIIIWKCDNRSASGKGAVSAWACYKKLGVSELQDIEDSLAYLKSLPYIDGNRIGISGWSYGGFMTAYALTHSRSFKMGVAGAGVHDWHLYDSIYTERYMDTPQNNPEGYKVSSVVEAAKDCYGRLLLLHGMMDDNVHLQNTIQLTYGLEKADKDFDMYLYPSPASRHGISDTDLNKHRAKVELDFIQKTLLQP